MSWRDAVVDVLHNFTRRTPGSVTEVKDSCVSWHYLDAVRRSARSLSLSLSSRPVARLAPCVARLLTAPPLSSPGRQDSEFGLATAKELQIHLDAMLQHLPARLFAMSRRKYIAVHPASVNKVRTSRTFFFPPPLSRSRRATPLTALLPPALRRQGRALSEALRMTPGAGAAPTDPPDAEGAPPSAAAAAAAAAAKEAAVLLAAWKEFDLVLCIGDERTDEEMFEFLAAGSHSITVAIGQKLSKAHYYADDTAEVTTALQMLASISRRAAAAGAAGGHHAATTVGEGSVSAAG